MKATPSFRSGVVLKTCQLLDFYQGSVERGRIPWQFARIAAANKTFLLLKIGNQHNLLNSAVTAIFDFCFERSYVTIFSYHGRTKKSFKSLGIFQVMQDTLSGRVSSPQDTDTITKVIINILKHAKK
ncbi:uncharacterized protein LOC107882355 [Acyrthosiphon pisum]|uniref:Uncharacterized protein n=1 Tax=Acyrthosiphon pisum TaxID=7029 RepID=A0A8R2D130_ACYPI|nr:uncharacterized protein LOC107882355 [Acyrthosiphon pisum]|eukprot:XP_016656083.1 PREDICTED: uncharacterized protein LOC107882355 [Acyrthosiphon pisum]